MENVPSSWMPHPAQDRRVTWSNPHCTQSYLDYPGDLGAILPTDFAEDARAAIHLVAARPEVRPNDVIVMGHSEGGIFVPRLAAEEPAVSAGVGLAGPSLSFVDSLAGQLEVLADYLEAQNAALFADDIVALRAEAADYRAAVEQIETGTYPSPTFLGVPLVHWLDMIAWFDAHRADFEANDKPLMLLSGELDFNVWPAHLATYEGWIEESGKSDVETWLVPQLTHALVPIVAGSPPLTHQVETEVPAEVVGHVVGWLAGS